MLFFRFPLLLFLSKCFFFCFNGFVDSCSTKPLLSLVNRASLDKILWSKVYVNEADGQLRVAYLILGYTPISRAFQAPKCVIKGRDPRLHRISVAYKGFVVHEGILIPEGTPFTQSLPVAILSAGISSSLPVPQEEEEGEEEREEEGFVDLTDSLDEFEVFNQTLSPKSLPEEMGIQRKPQKILMELIEDQLGRGAPGKSTQSKLPPFPPKSPPPASQPSLPSRTEQADPKRKREQKGKEVMETGRSRPTREEEAQGAAKQQKVSQVFSRGEERTDIQPPEPQAWLPAPMLGGEPLMDDTSMRDFNGGIGCHVASALEQTLLLPKDMVELRGLRKNKVFLNAKRYLGIV